MSRGVGSCAGIGSSGALLFEQVKIGTLPILALNLDRRPDRRMRAWAQFRREGLEVERVRALDAVGIAECRGWRNAGARACV